MAALANHLWQSTLFALAAAAFVATLRGNRASVRHWIWAIASVKWLVPFAWLVASGRALTEMFSEAGVAAAGVTTQPILSLAVRQFTEPFQAVESSPVISSAVTSGWLTTATIAIWACGVLALVAIRFRGWRRIHSAIRESAPLAIGLRSPVVDVRSAPGLLEPGVVGIWRPVMLLPAGIQNRLMPEHLESIIAHELCHIRRRDNLTATVHMVVESLFWFHPVVWWIGARMIEERERACDEDVLSRGAQPRDYAEGILSVCKLYVESPIACVSGVTGSDLKRRIEAIMTNRIGRTLSATRKVILTAAATFAIVAPVIVGTVAPSVRAQSAPPAVVSPSPTALVVGDLATVFKVMRDPSATAADKERLIGKTYSGIVRVDAVRLSPKGAEIIGYGGNPDQLPPIALTFTARPEAPKLQELRRGQGTRLRGTLTKFSTEGKIVWLYFADLVIEG